MVVLGGGAVSYERGTPVIWQVAAIRKRTSLLLDVHLVAQNPARYIDTLAGFIRKFQLRNLAMFQLRNLIFNLETWQ
jgi:hypothetical protein